MFRAPPLEESTAWTSTRRPAALLALVATKVEPLEGGFTLMHRLSGGGIVVRALRAPPTQRRLFGKVDPAGFRVAIVPDLRSISPFQPIIRAQVMAAPGGTRVEATFRPHPDARTHALLFRLMAAVLLLSSLMKGLSDPGFALVGCALAAVAVVVPTFRARWSFRQACVRSRAQLAEELDLVDVPTTAAA